MIHFLTLTLLSILLLGLIWFLLPFLLRRLAERQLLRLCQEQKAIVLSYDDGPGPGLTEKLADLLGQHQVAGTFFVLGRKIAGGEASVARLLRDGHEVGSHSFEHTNAWKVAPWRGVEDLAAGIAAVRAQGGDSTLYRPPYGKMTLGMMLQGKLQGQRFGWWTLDPKDTWAPADRPPAEQVLAQLGAMGGGVVLLHDFDKDCDPQEGMTHDDYVLSLTAQIIGFAKDNGYRIMPLGDVLRGAAA